MDKTKCNGCGEWVLPIDKYGGTTCIDEGRYCPLCGYLVEE